MSVQPPPTTRLEYLSRSNSVNSQRNRASTAPNAIISRPNSQPTTPYPGNPSTHVSISVPTASGQTPTKPILKKLSLSITTLESRFKNRLYSLNNKRCIIGGRALCVVLCKWFCVMLAILSVLTIILFYSVLLSPRIRVHSDLSAYGASKDGHLSMVSEKRFRESILVIAITAEWNQNRANNQIKNCEYFTENRIQCVISAAVDGKSLTDSDKQSLLKSNRIAATFPGWHLKGKLGCAEAGIRAYEMASRLSNADNSTIKHILIIEDDAVIPNDFIDNLRSKLTDIPNDWHLYQLKPNRGDCDRWFYLTIQHRLVRKSFYALMNGELVAGWTGTGAVLYRKATIDYLLRQLPMTHYNDLWIAQFIRDGEINAYISCPPIIPVTKLDQRSLITTANRAF